MKAKRLTPIGFCERATITRMEKRTTTKAEARRVAVSLAREVDLLLSRIDDQRRHLVSLGAENEGLRVNFGKALRECETLNCRIASMGAKIGNLNVALCEVSGLLGKVADQ